MHFYKVIFDPVRIEAIAPVSHLTWDFSRSKYHASISLVDVQKHSYFSTNYALFPNREPPSLSYKKHLLFDVGIQPENGHMK